MSFFGFDTSLPPNGQKADELGNELDFEDTYQGFGEHEQEEDDYLNSETFGDGADLGNDFDFGYGKGALEVASARSSEVQPTISYATAASQQRQKFDENVDLKPMESLWGNQPMPQDGMRPADQHPLAAQQVVGQKQQPVSQQGQMAMPPSFIGMPPQGMPVTGYGFAPQGYVQQPPQQYQYTPQGMPAQFPQAVPPQFQQMLMMMNQPQQQGQQPSQAQMHQIAMPPPPPGLQGEMPPKQIPQPEQQQQQQQQQPPQSKTHAQQQMLMMSAQQATPKMPEQLLSPPTQTTSLSQGPPCPAPVAQNQVPTPPHTPREFRRGTVRKHHEPLTEEEQKRFQIRQAKVDKILKHSGVMTPRDKDFITRYQLSQIVTEDPYNEDFYFQVYKIIQRGGIVGESNKGLIARAYLEHSGHRLGGRYKRADVALQRMQSQVEKAVTVAKERPQKNKDLDSCKEGVLGKISSAMNSRAPRRQLQIPTHKDDESDLDEQSVSSSSALDEVTHSLEGVDINKSKARRRSSYISSSIDQGSVLSRSGGRKFVLSLIESIYEEVLELEAQLRSGKQPEATKLWEALHIDDDAHEVSPFISILSFDKGVKIMPRIMNFLSKDQKMRLFSCFFSELSHLNIIVKSSFRMNPDPTDFQLKRIELFQSAFLKIIVSFLSSSAEFIEVMRLVLCLIKSNSISLISTSKIALNLITVLISRAALIKQDINGGSSSTEISTWNEVYDKLFTSLEAKLLAVFPPKEYMDKIIALTTAQQQNAPSSSGNKTPLSQKQTPQFYDQSYIWQFFASLALSGKLNHQRIIIDEIRDEIFGTITKAEELGKQSQDPVYAYQKDKMYQDLNLFLNVIGLVARDGEISELR
ncbi:HHL224Cp [Eremothecium sinecaudum]|uniref:HHL224Cp n=1 Tax=Eremothecium sinecaudum TaxID=45286 RepID=A0A109V0B0_9SACH|nr:HHL224Cp [Eremothecium sinecaudum]AMD22546.1 HHL224Cp [Eremothecium sinecaudum]